MNYEFPSFSLIITIVTYFIIANIIVVTEPHCSLSWSQTHYLTENDFELLILLPPSPKCCDYSLCPHVQLTVFSFCCLMVSFIINFFLSTHQILCLKSCEIRLKRWIILCSSRKYCFTLRWLQEALVSQYYFNHFMFKGLLFSGPPRRLIATSGSPLYLRFSHSGPHLVLSFRSTCTIDKHCHLFP